MSSQLLALVMNRFVRSLSESSELSLLSEAGSVTVGNGVGTLSKALSQRPKTKSGGRCLLSKLLALVMIDIVRSP